VSLAVFDQVSLFFGARPIVDGLELQTRFDNESALLERVRERLWFGWGGYGRHQKFSEYGTPLLIVDGEWIGIFTASGVVGFVGYYGLYVLPMFMAVRRVRAMFSTDFALLLGGLGLITALLVFETLPNSSGSLPHFFWAGALAGAAKGIAREDAARKARARELRRPRAHPQEAEPEPVRETVPESAVR